MRLKETTAAIPVDAPQDQKVVKILAAEAVGNVKEMEMGEISPAAEAVPLGPLLEQVGYLRQPESCKLSPSW